MEKNPLFIYEVDTEKPLVSTEKFEMVMQNYELLDKFRADIKSSEKSAGEERAPLVCNDKALLAIATYMPRSIHDLDAIPGVGNEFKDNYGQQFIDYINTISPMPIQLEKTQAKTQELYKQLQNRLVNLSKRNKLLYTPKLPAKLGVDLFGSEKSSDLTKKVMSSVVTKISPDNESLYMKMEKFKRESDAAIRETGVNDLFIASPFVIGHINKFPVRAPLALFPVSLGMEGDSFVIIRDETRDAFFNTTLILLFYKERGVSIDSLQDEYEEPTMKHFYEDMTNFYGAHNIKLDFTNVPFVKFDEYTSSDFPGMSFGSLVVQGNVVLGHFSLRSDAISKDFNALVAAGETHPFLQELVCPTDFMTDDMSAKLESSFETKRTLTTFDEPGSFYIDKLNKSQEDVLHFIQKDNKLVVNGPPGTGKSQTITSLIADAIMKDKNVLMVSEKKTALDVVYSRLKLLAKYALMIDDADDKKTFYESLSKIYNSKQTMQQPINIDLISNKIDSRLNQLDKLYRTLNTPTEFEDTPLDLYKYYNSLKAIIAKVDDKSSIIMTNVSRRVMSLSTQKIKEICAYYQHGDLIESFIKYEDISKQYPWLAEMNPGYGINQLTEIAEHCAPYLEKTKKIKNGFALFAKLRANSLKRKFKKSVGSRIGDSEKIFALLYNNGDNFFLGLDNYEMYQAHKAAYDSLSQEQKLYLGALRVINRDCGYDYAMSNKVLFAMSVYYKLLEFEKDNEQILITLSNFNNVLNEVEELLNKKQIATTYIAENKLHEASLALSQSKRRLDIAKTFTSKRRPSIKNFIKRYSFELFNGARIWFLTPDVVSEILPQNPNLFDLVIFDEASQMYIEKGLLAISRGKKIIIAGDSKQLKPSSLGFSRFEADDSIDELESETVVTSESLLDAAEYKWPSIMLNYHYRSKYSELISFSNHAFYNGELFVAPNIVRPTEQPITVDKVDGLWVNRQNMVEAQRVVQWLKTFFTTRQENETIGIVTFNISQKDLIDELIYEECKNDILFKEQVEFEKQRRDNGQDIGLFVKNIENVQGDERDVILFSTGYAKNNQGKLIRNFGWLNAYGGENRLNVAISRAKKHIHIITSLFPDDLIVDDMKNRGPKLLREYLRYAYAVNENNRIKQEQILCSLSDDVAPNRTITFDSPFEEEVYDALKKAGYTIDTQVGVGGYRIDMAIMKDGKYVLGIECDGAQYHRGDAVRTRDYHRQKYLESRGWKIHRIWSTSWWRNKQAEIDKIKAIMPV